MKQLILVRHGKSSWDYNVSDRDRPLQQRGVHDAIMVADRFNDLGITIDAFYSSPANRACHTGTIFLRQLFLPIEQLRLTDSIYDFAGNDVMQFIKELDDSVITVLLFGHNHAFTHIANLLGNTYIENLPTSGLVMIRFKEEHWSDVDKGSTLHTIFPKHLR